MAFARSVVLASALTAVSALPAPPAREQSGLIVGGEDAVAGDFPYIVSLEQGGSHFCGGTLISADTVLTAAHCSTGASPSSLTVRAGTLTRGSGGVTAGVSEIIIHPSYSSSTLNNDVAIWKLSETIAESSDVSYASLASAGSDPAAGDSLTVAGWGTTSEGGGSLPSALQKVTVPTVGRAECNDSYGGDITEQMICAGFPEGGQDACQGDSGGPIADDASGAVVGVVSWGQGCARPGFPGVYAGVGALSDFITSN